LLASSSVFQSASVAGQTQQQSQPCGKPRTLTASQPRAQSRAIIFQFCLWGFSYSKANHQHFFHSPAFGLLNAKALFGFMASR